MISQSAEFSPFPTIDADEISVSSQIAKSCLPVALSLLLYSALAHGQASEVSAFPNGRPAVNSGTDLVSVRTVQIENGFSWTDDGHSKAFDGPESLMRIGLSHRVELQITLPDTETPGACFDDFALGAKIKIGSDHRTWPVAMAGTLSFPTGSKTLTSGGVDPTLLLAISHNFSHDIQISGSLDITSFSEIGAVRTTRSQLALDLGWCIKSDTCMFAEAAPFLSSGSAASGITTDAGMTLKLAPRLPFDWRIGRTIQPGGSTVFVSLGYSFRRTVESGHLKQPARKQRHPPRYPRFDADSSPARTP